MVASASPCGTIVYHVWFLTMNGAPIEELEDSLSEGIAGVLHTSVQTFQGSTMLSIGLVVSQTLDRLIDQVDCLVWGWSQMHGVDILPRQSLSP